MSTSPWATIYLLISQWRTVHEHLNGNRFLVFVLRLVVTSIIGTHWIPLSLTGTFYHNAANVTYFAKTCLLRSISHQRSAKGKIRKKKRQQTRVIKTAREALFTINGTPINREGQFKNLGRAFEEADNDSHAIDRQLKRARLKERKVCVLSSQGAEPRVSK